MWYKWNGSRLLVHLRVQPKASRDQIQGLYGDDALKVQITAPPIDGKANRHLIAFLAKRFDVSKSAVSLLRGECGKNKWFEINSPAISPEMVMNERK